MIRYHLKRNLNWLFLVVIVIIGFLSWVYRRGGSWLGQSMSYYAVLQYWSLITTVLLFGIATTMPSWHTDNRAYDPINVARPQLKYLIFDGLARLATVLLPVVLVGVLGSLFLQTRVGDILFSESPTKAFPPALDKLTVWLVFWFGPLPGIALWVAISDLIATWLQSSIWRLITLGTVALADAANRIGLALISPSGTTLGIAQTHCCGDISQTVQSNYDYIGELMVRPALWGAYAYRMDGTPYAGPLTTAIAPSLLQTRAALGIVAILLMIAAAWLRQRQLNRLFNDE
ncbi:hypothetical protein [Herpetosiphon giganteus]|uniref:hypothetical protein n=1 Tax=Herpetosiphon giganteus TaxID=2029754 RepID=UPI00195C7697|nr:hypothetical protein [Herpetosiphon giganteus]MBM7842783.1 hypothetical protein [Herpetosiphon giganteus]